MASAQRRTASQRTEGRGDSKRPNKRAKVSGRKGDKVPMLEWSSDDEFLPSFDGSYHGFALDTNFEDDSQWGDQDEPAAAAAEAATASVANAELRLLLTDLFPHETHESHAATRHKCLLLRQVVASGVSLPADILWPLFDRLTHPMTPYRLSLEIYQTLRQLLATNPNLWTPRPKDWPLFLGVLQRICTLSSAQNDGRNLQHNYALRKSVLLLQCFVSAFYDDLRMRETSGADMQQSLLTRLISLADLQPEPDSETTAPKSRGRKLKKVAKASAPSPGEALEDKLLQFVATIWHSVDQCNEVVSHARIAAESAKTNTALLELLLVTVSSCVETLKHCVTTAFPGLG